MNSTPDQSAFGARNEAPKPIVPKSASEALRPAPGPKPPERKKASRRARSQTIVFLNFLMSAIVLMTIAAGVALWYGKTSFESSGPLTSNTTVNVKPNSGLNEIALLLERNGVIRDSNVFRVGVRAYGNEGELKAGEYEVKSGASMHEIMDLLKSGKSVLYSLTVPEGITVEQVFQRIAANEVLTGEMPATMPPEGAMIADTQRFARGTSRQEVVDKMAADQARLVDAIWERRIEGLPLKDINEFVTLASIVEKETGRGDERSRVAAVFINRLNKGMRLQSDPTIIYGIYGGKGKPADKPITRSDIDTPTPYNTYSINGLLQRLSQIPVGRHSRRSQILAHRRLLFVADGTGGHVFAKTLEEHNRNVARWRAIEKKQADEAKKAASGKTDGAEQPAGSQ